jgi:ribonuclease T1
MVQTKKEYWLSVILALVVGLAIGYFVFPSKKSNNNNNPTIVNPNNNKVNNNNDNSTQKNNKENRNNNNRNQVPPSEGNTKGSVPDYVMTVYEYVMANGKAPEGYVGGRIFMNRENQLPMTDGNGKIQYQEWDVFPKVRGQNRGAERMVTGANGTAYYTKDHYRSFTQFK